MADGLDEAARGLWPSAVESFARAAVLAPEDPAPVLAEAVCHLKHGEPDRALVRLETAPALRDPGAPWALRRDWLIVAARLAHGDFHGAERAARQLPRSLMTRARAAIHLTAGEYAAGLTALLATAGR